MTQCEIFRGNVEGVLDAEVQPRPCISSFGSMTCRRNALKGRHLNSFHLLPINRGAREAFPRERYGVTARWSCRAEPSAGERTQDET
jgi:hypothetical protein